MSLHFYFGPSEEELCCRVYEEIIAKSMENPKTNYLVLVPDQFTMQTQKQLVAMHPKGGILNIDVLSFGRLHHRIMEEMGQESVPVLDDTGKSLVLQKVAAGLKEECPVLGSNLSRQGYIHEVKSAISEFMQYGIGVEDVTKLIEFSSARGALTGKLKDLQTIYRGFKEYIQDRFITTEETLDILCRNVSGSKIVKNSVIVLNGFTGFTPVQNRLVQELMRYSSEFIMTLTLGEGESPYTISGEQELFYLTRKTVADLEELAWDAGVSRNRGEDKFFGVGGKNKELTFLASNLLSYGQETFEEPCEAIRLFETRTPKAEVLEIASTIKRLTLEQGLAYRDIAIIMGNLDESAPLVEREFARLGIPYFMDRTRSICLNPLVEQIKSALELFERNFSYDSVLHYLRTGLSDFTREEVDVFENYILATGIRGKRKYSKLFTAKLPEMTEEDLAQMNAYRLRFMEPLTLLDFTGKETVETMVNALYDFLTGQRAQEKLAAFEKQFEEKSDAVRAKEYGQIYRLVMELLEQIHGLLGEEVISVKEFSEILTAGFGEIEVGIIPKQVDRVLVGDMQRTRLRDVKVLFFAGMNDGNIPRGVTKGGIISDLDREFLRQSALELAPSPRQQMYIQRFYLYLNMNKPKERLYLSYTRMNAGGKTTRPSYLVEEIKKMYPSLKTEYPEWETPFSRIQSKEEGWDYLADNLREYAGGTLSEEKRATFFALYDSLEQDAERRSFLEETAFGQFGNKTLSSLVALALYGQELAGSITRLETYAGCAYRYFLQYGLSLKKRKEFGFEAIDMGNIYHGVLETFSKRLEEQNQTWFTFDEKYAGEEIHKAMEEMAATYGAAVLYSSHKNLYAIRRMEKILLRTVMTMKEQLMHGEFVPKAYELSFRRVDRLSGEDLQLNRGGKMLLQGKIDRVDLAQYDDKVLVKVVDYKSGDKKFDLVEVYNGLALQLVVYLKYAMDREKQLAPEKDIIPAAMLYYHVTDPILETQGELTDEEREEGLTQALRMDGIVNRNEEILERLDRGLEGKSQVIPITRKKGGELSDRGSKVFGEEDMDIISKFVNRKIVEMGNRILGGDIAQNPYQRGDRSACTYCDFKKICGFDEKLPGCSRHRIYEMNQDTVLEKMKE